MSQVCPDLDSSLDPLNGSRRGRGVQEIRPTKVTPYPSIRSPEYVSDPEDNGWMENEMTAEGSFKFHFSQDAAPGPASNSRGASDTLKSVGGADVHLHVKKPITSPNQTWTHNFSETSRLPNESPVETNTAVIISRCATSLPDVGNGDE